MDRRYWVLISRRREEGRKNAAHFLRSPRRGDHKQERKFSKEPKKSASDRLVSVASGVVPSNPLTGVGRRKKPSFNGPILLPTASQNSTLADLAPSRTDLIPIFVRKCFVFIEAHGLNAEGIYRILGNQAHVQQLQQKFLEDPNISFEELDVPMNAVATALKNFFSELHEPVVPYNVYDDLMLAMSLPDRTTRMNRIRDTLRRLPNENEEMLKYLIRYLRKSAS